MHKPLCNSTYDCSLCLYLFHLPCWNSCVCLHCCVVAVSYNCALSMHVVAKPLSISHPDVTLCVYSCLVDHLLLCLFLLYVTSHYVLFALSYTVLMLTLKPNSWTYNCAEVSGHTLESSQTWGFCMDFLNHREGDFLSGFPPFACTVYSNWPLETVRGCVNLKK